MGVEHGLRHETLAQQRTGYRAHFILLDLAVAIGVSHRDRAEYPVYRTQRIGPRRESSGLRREARLQIEGLSPSGNRRRVDRRCRDVRDDDGLRFTRLQ